MDTLSLASFADEIVKISKSMSERAGHVFNKGHAKADRFFGRPSDPEPGELSKGIARIGKAGTGVVKDVDDTVRYVLGDERPRKIAFSMPNERKERIKRHLIDAGAVGLGTGIGYGLGSAAGRMMGHKYPHSKALALGAAGISGAGLLLKRIMDRKREAYVNQPVEHS